MSPVSQQSIELFTCPGTPTECSGVKRSGWRPGHTTPSTMSYDRTASNIMPRETQDLTINQWALVLFLAPNDVVNDAESDD